MKTGLLMVTHEGIASALLRQARRILNDPMEAVTCLEVGEGVSDARAQLQRALQSADQGQGVLVLTDLPGATPANLAQALRGDGCHVISGLSLPMLIRAWNYRDRALDVLAVLAIEGARSAAMELD